MPRPTAAAWHGCAELFDAHDEASAPARALARAYYKILAEAGSGVVTEQDLISLLGPAGIFSLDATGPSHRTHLHRALQQLGQVYERLPQADQSWVASRIFLALRSLLDRVQSLEAGRAQVRAENHAITSARTTVLEEPGRAFVFPLRKNRMGIVTTGTDASPRLTLSSMDAETGAIEPAVARIELGEEIRHLVQGGKVLIGAGRDRVVYVWRIATGRLVRTLETGRLLIGELTATDDGNWIVAGSVDNSLLIWKYGSSAPLVATTPEYAQQAGTVTSIRILPQSNRILTALTNGDVRAWKLSDGSFEGQLARGDQGYGDALLAHSGKFLVKLRPDGVLRQTILDGSFIKGLDAKPTQEHDYPLLPRLDRYFSVVSTLSRGDRFAAFGLDNEIWLVDLSGPTAVRLNTKSFPISRLSFSEDEGFLFASTARGAVERFDLRQILP